MPTIRIDNDVYSWLKSQAIPFEDTPNSVLRRFAGLDKPKSLEDKELYDNNGSDTKIGKKEIEIKQIQDKQITGKYLARLWKVDVIHALYHKDGTWYNHLTKFPGALFDRNGYIIFNTKREYENNSYLHHGQELNVPGRIRSIPGYRHVR